MTDAKTDPQSSGHLAGGSQTSNRVPWALVSRKRRKRAGADEDLKKAINKRLYLLRKSFMKAQKLESVKQRRGQGDLLQRTMREREQTARDRPSVPVLRTATLPIEEVPGELRAGKIEWTCSISGSLPLTVCLLPLAPTIPRYKAWSYLVRNEVAEEVGQKMFYTDSTGETVPASDSEEEGRGGASLDGIYRERETFVVRSVLEEMGSRAEVVQALADRLDATPAAVEGLVREEGKPAQKAMAKAPAVLGDILESFDSHFCRRCRVYNCLAHRSKHAKPITRPTPPETSPPGLPCGDACFKHGVTERPSLRKRPREEPRNKGQSQLPSGMPSAKLAKEPPSRQGGQQMDDVDVIVLSDSSSDSQGGVCSNPVAVLRDNTIDLGDTLTEGESARQARTDFGRLRPERRSRRNDGAGRNAGDTQQQRTGWSAYEEEALDRSRFIFGDDPCKIARLIGSRRCKEVAAALKRRASSCSALYEAEVEPDSRRGVFRRKPWTYQRKQSKIVIKRSQHTDPLWEEYLPCSCEGGCGSSCPCYRSKHFCEKFCACGPGCPHYFPGCVCTSGCHSRLCPCWAAGKLLAESGRWGKWARCSSSGGVEQGCAPAARECDPDVCKGCQCAALGEGPPAGKEVCKNMGLRLRQHKRVAVGLSSIAGWGAFLMEPARKNELIGEYTGELVDQQEAERRGKVYDRDDNSYLFNLNHSWVVDARMQGNKLRFANHSTDPNCLAKILMVDGDHRVGIFALRDIAAGDELLYNYLYTTEQAPDWAKST